MNILILNWRDPKNPKSGGAEIVTHEHAKAWIRNGHKVVWLSSMYKGAKHKEKIGELEIVRIGNYVTVYFLAPFYFMLNRKKVDLVVDEIHGFPFFTPLYVRKPIIAIIHEVADEIWNYMFPLPVSLMGLLLESFYFKLYKKTKFLVPSKSTLDDLVDKGIPKRNITLFECGVTVRPYVKTKKELNATFIFVSRLVKMKGIHWVIEAFDYIQNQLPSSMLWVVGDGDEKDVKNLKKIVEDKKLSDNVIFFGKVSEKRKFDLMRRAHLLLHASVKEGWGLVVIEAASQRTPSVVYNVGGLKDSVLNGLTGIVISKNNPSILAQEALKLVSDPVKYRILQDNAFKNSKKYTWSNSTRTSCDLITKCYKDYV